MDDQIINVNDRVQAIEGKHAFKYGVVVSIESWSEERVQVRFDGEPGVRHVIACQLCRDER